MQIANRLIFDLIYNFTFVTNLEKSAKSTADDAKSNATDENNTSAAESTIPLDDDNSKSNTNLSTREDKGNVCKICNSTLHKVN